MKKLIACMLTIFAAIPLILAVWGFAVPAQYRETFVGELPAKREPLKPYVAREAAPAQAAEEKPAEVAVEAVEAPAQTEAPVDEEAPVSEAE